MSSLSVPSKLERSLENFEISQCNVWGAHGSKFIDESSMKVSFFNTSKTSSPSVKTFPNFLINILACVGLGYTLVLEWDLNNKRQSYRISRYFVKTSDPNKCVQKISLKISVVVEMVRKLTLMVGLSMNSEPWEPQMWGWREGKSFHWKAGRFGGVEKT